MNGKFKFAKDLIIGDTILTYDHLNNKQIEEKIQKIHLYEVHGFIAPLTLSGTILVDDILISCYAIIENHNLAHSIMAPVRWWSWLQDKIINPNIPEISKFFKIEKQLNGTHWFPAYLSFISSYSNLI